MDTKSLAKSDSFCILPWMSMQLNQDGAILPCCRTDESFEYGNTRNSTIESSWNSPSIRGLRRTLLAGVKPDTCRDCHLIEASGAKSSRQVFNERYSDSFDLVGKTKDDGALETFDIRFLGLRFSNTCNLRCRTCGPKNSTAWYSDAKVLDILVPRDRVVTPKDSFEELARELAPMLPTLEAVYFAGGEPLLHEEHYKFLEMLIDAGRTDIELQYNTNLTRLSLGRRNVLDLWRRFKTVVVSASLDGVGHHSELIRKGSNWEEIVANFYRLQFLENVRFTIACTISVLNCFQLPEALDEWLQRKMIRHPQQFEVNILREPKHLSLQNLTQEERDRLRVKYQTYLESRARDLPRQLHEGLRDSLEFILASAKGSIDPSERSRLAHQSKVLDQTRGESLAEVVPELADTLNRSE